MSRNTQEIIEQFKMEGSMKFIKARPTRESEPLREQKYLEQQKRYIPPNTLYKKTDSKHLKTLKSKDLTSFNIPFILETNSNNLNPSIFPNHQNQHYKQPNDFKKYLSPKEQINNSIIMIENILKKGIRPSLKDQQKDNYTKKGGRYSQPLQQQPKNNKKQIFYVKKQQKNLITKASLLETMCSNNQTINYNLKIQDFMYIKELGRGKFGVVSLAIHLKTNFFYAIKAMSKRAIMSQNILDQIIREVKIQHFISHPNIVKLYDIFNDEEHLYLIMEYCNGGQFYRMIEKRGKIPENQAKVYVKQICNGVQELHHHGIIHRDLKPQNIVMSFGMLKICDFGWSVASKNCLRSTFCGTPLYVSPQLLIGNDYNEKVDLWAIGIITYEMLTGEIPFKISTQKQLMKIIDSSINYPPYMSQNAQNFIQELLDKNPKSRATITEVLKHQFLANSSCEQLNQSKSIGSIRRVGK